MFSFYVLLTGHYMVTDAGRTTTRRRKIKPNDYKQSYKNEGTFENMSFNRKSLKISDQKKTRNNILDLLKNPVEHTAPRYNNWIRLFPIVRI